jgi:putative hydrolase of the HAD superfamily
MHSKGHNIQIHPDFTWSQIDTVLLDMDGTLLDKYFDDFFWEEYVPRIFAEQNQMTSEQARKELLKRYQSVESTLQWTDLDYWSEQLGIDIPELKCKVEHLIQVHPFVIDFLRFLRGIGKKIHLVTNAHSKTLEIKMRRTELGVWFDRIVCAEEVGEAKEHPVFWNKLEEMLNYNRKRTLLADDTTKVLRSAKIYEMGFLIFIARPSSRLPACYSEEFPSIITFDELIF